MEAKRLSKIRKKHSMCKKSKKPKLEVAEAAANMDSQLDQNVRGDGSKYSRDDETSPVRVSEQSKRKKKKTKTTNNTLNIIKQLRERVKWLEQTLKEQMEKFEVLKEETERTKASHQEQLMDQKKQIEKLEMEKEIYEEKEECRKFLYLFKDISAYKTIGKKLRGCKKLDQNEQQTVLNHGKQLAAHGGSLQKRKGISGLHDAQNGDGHYFIDSGAIEECLRLLRCRPYVYRYYNIDGGSIQQTIHAIESARVSVQFVNQYVQGQLTKGTIGKKKTRTRYGRRKGSSAKFSGSHPLASGAPVLRRKGRPRGGVGGSSS